MSSRRDPESSLELLLDTMCNTFGGVMFIAISLIVMLSMVRESEDALERTGADAGQLRSEIAALQARLEDGTEAALAEQLERLERAGENDPRARLVAETAALESELAEITTRIEESERQLDGNRSEAAKLTADAAAIGKELQLLDEAIAAAEKSLRQNTLKITGLKTEMTTEQPDTLNFAVLSAKQIFPYYLVVSDGKVWKVGPDEDTHKPNPAVRYQQTGNQVECFPLPNQGVDIFAGEVLSGNFRALLNGISQNCAPYFIVSGKDAENFFRLREILKQEQKLHGFTLTDQVDSFIYYYVDQATYEY